MPAPRFFRRDSHTSRGVALVIILAMVVLVSGLVLAYFSRAISEHQISSSSVNQTRVDLFAQGAYNTIIGDIQQEIAAGSTLYSPPSPTPSVTLYIPTSAATAVPCRVGTANALPNLVKTSASGQAFYSGTAYSANYPASNRASTAPTTTPAQNGRTVTVQRWNLPLLLPKKGSATGTDYTPAATFTPPNWVLVARDGSNPTTYNANMAVSSSATTTVIGRYAYNIYNEGGLLDVNAAGYPTASTAYPAQSSGSLPLQPTRKSLLAYADLTVPVTNSDGSTQPLLTPAEVNALVGWRNYAAGQESGSFPSYTPAPTPTTGTPLNLAPFDVSVLTSTSGFLSTMGAALNNGQSDRSFASRQQLVSFLLQSVASSSAEVGSLQNSLQYLGTFSRALNQPSFIRPQSTNSSSTMDYDATAPKIVSGTGGNDGAGGDDVINPSFLRVRAATAFVRNDGSIAKVGVEPLVKKRFALNRLAWLTYTGPSSAASTAVLQPLLNAGFTSSFLSQGTAQNIYNYFGLSWVQDPNNPANSEWVYSHQGTAPITSSSPSTAAILTLANITTRDPDFFELLKACMDVGSLAKAYASSTTVAAGTPGKYQSTRDQSVDAAIIQLGANIVDQFDTDSYSTRILANTGLFGTTQEYRGVEDLPYLYRVREGRIMVRDSTPASTTFPATVAGASSLTDGGAGIALQEPEIWNPHAWNSSVADTNPRPQNFRLVALTTDPNGNATSSISLLPQWRPNTSGSYSYSTPTSLLALTSANTELDFNVPTGDLYLFREPTLLIKPGVPAGSGLAVGAGNTINTLAGASYITSKYPATQYKNNAVSDNQQYIGIATSATYLPMAWYVPALAPDSINATTPAATSPGVVPIEYLNVVAGGPITYRLQYKDNTGSWITYDEKFSPMLSATSYNTWDSVFSGYGRPFAVSGDGVSASDIIGFELFAKCFDPRTSRFGMNYAGPNGLRGNSLQYTPVVQTANNSPYTTAFTAGWASPAGSTVSNATSAAQNALWTERPDENPGFVFGTYNVGVVGYCHDTGAGALGWYPAGTASANDVGYTTGWLRPGLYAQNNPGVASSSSVLRFPGDSAAGSGTPGLACFADPDGVVRRGMSAYVAPTSSVPAAYPVSGAPSGLPLTPAYAQGSGTITPNAEAGGRPIMLNRPFRSVAELGYVFSGTPWRNLDLFTPESGSAALLDVFCLNDTDDANALEAGRVDLNTRQAPVLQAILSGAYKDELTASSTTNSVATAGSVTAATIAAGLVTRTSDTAGTLGTGSGPLRNVSDLVGRWTSSPQTVSGATTPFNVDGGKSYAGFSGTTATTSAVAANPPTLSYILGQDTSATGYATNVVERQRESIVRALAGTGQTRVWNLMIDLVSQIGRYPQSANSANSFIVEGEQRYWIHLAIDRYTGKVIDKQIEVVKE